jgi:hypothetical protein
MAFMSSDKGGSGNFEPVAAGAHPARCVSVVDLGVQQTPWGGKEKCYIGFEVPSQRVEWTDKEGKEHEGPALIGMTLTNSINEKSNLGQLLTSWRGKPFTDDERQGFDLFSILGAPALINVVHKMSEDKTKMFANINSIMRLPQGMEAATPETEQIAYSPMDANTSANFDKLPEWLQKRVRDGYQMLPDSNQVGSAARASAPGNTARAEALATAGAKGAQPPAPPPPAPDWDDDIPF